MRIGFDAKRMFHNFTGLGNYARSTVRNLLLYYDDIEATLFTPDVHPEWEFLADEYKDILVKGPKFFPRIWRTVGMKQPVQNHNIQLFHGLSNELPYIPMENRPKFVVTIHDLIFIKYPEYYPFIDRAIYTQKMKSAGKRADRIIATSEVTKRDIMEVFNVKEDKISVIYQDCAEIYRTERKEIQHPDLQAKLPDNFVLCVASFEKRKNHLNLLEAYLKVANDVDYHLVLAGRPKDTYDEVIQFIERHALGDRVVIITDSSDSEIKQMLDQAAAFVFPSFYEGFGIPVLEALYAQNVILTTENSSMAEIAGEAGLYFDPNSVDSIAEKLKKVSSQDEYYTRAWNAISGRLKQFAPETLTAQLHDLYKEVIYPVKTSK